MKQPAPGGEDSSRRSEIPGIPGTSDLRPLETPGPREPSIPGIPRTPDLWISGSLGLSKTPERPAPWPNRLPGLFAERKRFSSVLSQKKERPQAGLESRGPCVQRKGRIRTKRAENRKMGQEKMETKEGPKKALWLNKHFLVRIIPLL